MLVLPRFYHKFLGGYYIMAITNSYLKRVFDGLSERCANEPEFLQAVEEVLESLEPVAERRPDLLISKECSDT